MAFKNVLKSVVLICLAVFSLNVSFASEGKEHKKEELNIQHHIMDAHEWHLWGETSVYLPINLLDGGLQTFSSKELYHGTKIVNYIYILLFLVKKTNLKCSDGIPPSC